MKTHCERVFKRFLTFSLVTVCLFLLCSCGKGERFTDNTPAPSESGNPSYEELVAKGKAWFESKKSAAVQIEEAHTGDRVVMGEWELDGDSADGREEIEWLVLDEKDGKMLLITSFCIDSVKYHIHPDGAVWKDCFMREWLNGEFLNGAFSEEEKSKIVFGKIVTRENKEFRFRGDVSTEDSIFLLSADEAEKYFQDEGSGKAQGAPKVNRGIVTGDFDVYCDWWLRTTGGSGSRSTYVTENGTVSYSGKGVYDGMAYTRPAMWVEVTSDN